MLLILIPHLINFRSVKDKTVKRLLDKNLLDEDEIREEFELIRHQDNQEEESGNLIKEVNLFSCIFAIKYIIVFQDCIILEFTNVRFDFDDHIYLMICLLGAKLVLSAHKWQQK
jgi:hypothetical protein